MFLAAYGFSPTYVLFVGWPGRLFAVTCYRGSMPNKACVGYLVMHVMIVLHMTLCVSYSEKANRLQMDVPLPW